MQGTRRPGTREGLAFARGAAGTVESAPELTSVSDGRDDPAPLTGLQCAGRRAVAALRTTAPPGRGGGVLMFARLFSGAELCVLVKVPRPWWYLLSLPTHWALQLSSAQAGVQAPRPRSAGSR